MTFKCIRARPIIYSGRSDKLHFFHATGGARYLNNNNATKYLRGISTTALATTQLRQLPKWPPGEYWAVGVLPGPGARAKASKVHRF